MTTTDATGKLFGTGEPSVVRRRAFVDGEVPVAVYGLGKIGLPLAVAYATAAPAVIGVDVDESVVRAVNRGDCPFDHEPGLPAALARVVAEDALCATTDADAAAAAAAVHVVIVPTTLDANGDVDLSALREAVRTIGASLDRGDIVVIESTVPPGTCRDTVVPLLEAESGLGPGEFGVAFCPERTSSGRALRDIRRSYPKVVGGTDDESTRVAALLYGEITANEVIEVPDSTTAECVKLFEGVYRDVNIALANELARLGEDLGVDVREAITAANTQPYCDLHDPGVGVGGHCIPYYPYFLIDRAPGDASLLRAARGVNDDMPRFAVQRLLELFRDRGVEPAGATVLVLGLTYRPGIPETRESPAFPIIDALARRGVEVLAADPVVEGPLDSGVTLVPTDRITEASPDGVVLVTAHDEFEGIDWTAFEDLVVVDGRDALSIDDADHLVYTIGRG